MTTDNTTEIFDVTEIGIRHLAEWVATLVPDRDTWGTEIAHYLVAHTDLSDINASAVIELGSAHTRDGRPHTYTLDGDELEIVTYDEMGDEISRRPAE